jgi:hypothetical protein
MRGIDCTHCRTLKRFSDPELAYIRLNTIIFLNQGQESVFKVRLCEQSIPRL